MDGWREGGMEGWMDGWMHRTIAQRPCGPSRNCTVEENLERARVWPDASWGMRASGFQRMTRSLDRPANFQEAILYT